MADAGNGEDRVPGLESAKVQGQTEHSSKKKRQRKKKGEEGEETVAKTDNAGQVDGEGELGGTSGNDRTAQRRLDGRRGSVGVHE